MRQIVIFKTLLQIKHFSCQQINVTRIKTPQANQLITFPMIATIYMIFPNNRIVSGLCTTPMRGIMTTLGEDLNACSSEGKKCHVLLGLRNQNVKLWSDYSK